MYNYSLIAPTLSFTKSVRFLSNYFTSSLIIFACLKHLSIFNYKNSGASHSYVPVRHTVMYKGLVLSDKSTDITLLFDDIITGLASINGSVLYISILSIYYRLPYISSISPGYVVILFITQLEKFILSYLKLLLIYIVLLTNNISHHAYTVLKVSFELTNLNIPVIEFPVIYEFTPFNYI